MAQPTEGMVYWESKTQNQDTQSVDTPRNKNRKNKRQPSRRDSLRSRLKGRRAAHRLLNELFLQTRENMNAEDQEELQEIFRIEFHSYFEELFKGENRAIFEPLCEVTEEEQNLILSILESTGYQYYSHASGQPVSLNPAYYTKKHLIETAKKNKLKPVNAPAINPKVEAEKYKPIHLFKNVDKKARPFLKRHPEYEFLNEVERIAINYIIQENKKPVTLVLDDPLHRLLAHAVCQFYGLNSKSEDTNDLRITIIEKPKKYFFPLPPVSLVAYLYSLQQ